jgi:hypothetical protein
MEQKALFRTKRIRIGFVISRRNDDRTSVHIPGTFLPALLRIIMRTITIDDRTLAVMSTLPDLFTRLLADENTVIVNASADQTDQTDESIRHDTPEEVAIAAACHEANRQYCRSMGDYSQQPWSEAPGLVRASVIEGVRNIRDGLITKPEEAHARWMASYLDLGWVYGPEKSYVHKTHPNLRPFTDLSAAEQRKDTIFFTLASVLLGKRLIIAET